MTRSVWAYGGNPVTFSIVNPYLIDMYLGLQLSRSYIKVMRND